MCAAGKRRSVREGVPRMDEDQRAELRYELGDRIDRLWDLLGA